MANIVLMISSQYQNVTFRQCGANVEETSVTNIVMHIAAIMTSNI